MPKNSVPKSLCRISICIPTYNRANLISATLDSILAQITDECEVVISDNASRDNTAEVVSRYARRFGAIRYSRNETNIGLDRNYDRAVELSRGEYCWLMTDDDVMKPGAIAAVLNAINSHDYSLVVVNVERRNFDLSRVLVSRIHDISEDRIYPPEDTDRLAVDGYGLMISCGLVLKRAVWLSRNRELYYGSLFVHVGVIFQQPLPSSALMIAIPFIAYRDGHTRSFWPQLFEILMIRWPSLIWSLPLGREAKMQICSMEPWKNLTSLFLYRGAGWYTFADYKKFVRPRLRFRREGIVPALVALLPGRILNTLLLFYYSIATTRGAKLSIQFLQQSPFYIGRR